MIADGKKVFMKKLYLVSISGISSKFIITQVVFFVSLLKNVNGLCRKLIRIF